MAGHRRSVEQQERQRQAHRVYSSRWANLRAEGAKPVVIDRQGQPEQWRAWHGYFQSKGLAMLVEMMDNGHERTVPTDWPHDFDGDAPTVMERRHAD